MLPLSLAARVTSAADCRRGRRRRSTRSWLAHARDRDRGDRHRDRFNFKFSKASVPHGSVTFTLVNKGNVGHDFKIGGKKTPVVSPGKSAKLTVTLKAGKAAYCAPCPATLPLA